MSQNFQKVEFDLLNNLFIKAGLESLKEFLNKNENSLLNSILKVTKISMKNFNDSDLFL